MNTLIFDHRPRLTWGGVKHWWETVDRPLIACAFFLISLGIVLNFATSPALAARNGVDPFYYVTRQAVFAVPAILLMLALSMASPKVIRRFGVLLFCATIALLMLVLLIGASRNGSQRWLSLVFFSLQPSELVKPALVAASAWMFSVNDCIPRGATTRLQSDGTDLRGMGYRLFSLWCARQSLRSARADYGEQGRVKELKNLVYLMLTLISSSQLRQKNTAC